MLYVMPAYWMPFTALFNVACLHNTYIFAIKFCKCFLFSCFVFGNWHIVCLLQISFGIMHSAFNLLVFVILCSHSFFKRKGYVISGEIAHKNNHFSYYFKWAKKV